MSMHRKKNIENLFSDQYRGPKEKASTEQGQEKEGFIQSLPDLLGISIKPGILFILLLFGGVLSWYMAFQFLDSIVLSLLFLASLIFGFTAIINSRRHARQDAFTQQLPDTLSAVANSLKAGFSLDQSFQFVSESMPEPTKTEFHRIHMNYRVGYTMAESLRELSHRYPNAEVMLFVSSMILQNQVGGNVIPFLLELGVILRERLKLKNQIKVGTAQVRLSSMIIAVIPYFMLVLLHFSGYRALSETFRGVLVLMLAVMLQMVGMAIISTFMKVDL